MAKITGAEYDEQASTPATPSSGSWKLYPKTDGFYTLDDAGAETGPLGASAGSGGIPMKKARRTSGNITLNSTAWANVDTGLDLTLDAAAGDEIVYGLSAVVSAAAPFVWFDVVTVVSGTITNSFGRRAAVEASPGDQGVSAWWSDDDVIAAVSGTAPPYTVQAGDIVSGAVTLRLRYATDTAVNRLLNATTTIPLDVWAQNTGPLEA